MRRVADLTVADELTQQCVAARQAIRRDFDAARQRVAERSEALSVAVAAFAEVPVVSLRTVRIDVRDDDVRRFADDPLLRI